MADDLERAHNRAVELASALDLRTASIEDERRLAEAVIDVRAHIRTRKGAVDWMGTSGEAKSRASEIYSAIHGDEKELSRLKARLRQHYSAIVPERMSATDVASVVEESEDLMSGERFFDDIGVFVTNHGRPTRNSVEAIQVALVAQRLVSLISIDPILAEDGAAAQHVSVTLQAVVDTAARTLQNLR